MSSTSSEKTIATFQMLVSDNRPELKSQEFEQFLKRNGIKHITSATYHPATNGLAERCVESFDNGMKRETKMKSLDCFGHHPSCFWEEDYALDWTF